MKFTRSDFLSADDGVIVLDMDIPVPDDSVFENTLVSGLDHGVIEGKLIYDGRSRVQALLHLEGELYVQDSFTGEDVPVEFETDIDPLYSFDPDPDEEVIRAGKDGIDLSDAVYEAIAFEAPMSITTLSRQDYPSGAGWSVVSDQDEPEDKDEIDPRWKKLSEFQIEDD